MLLCGSSVFLVKDNEYGLHEDYEKWLEVLAPHEPTSQCRPRGRWHNRTGEDNANVHLKWEAYIGQMHLAGIGRGVVVAVTNDRLHLSTWEQIV
jgi:thiamine phosphate synthase YjbQ (UPF0047 family)